MNQNPCQHNLVLPARKQCEMKSVVNVILSFYNQECLTDIVMYHKKEKKKVHNYKAKHFETQIL